MCVIQQADSYPEKLDELREYFYLECAKYNIFPIDNTRMARLAISTKPSLTAGRTEFHYYDGPSAQSMW